MNSNTILVIAEYFEGKINPITDELIASALEISAIINRQTFSADASRASVKVLHIKGINPLESERYKSCLVPIIKAINPSFILMGHTSQGIDVAPALSVRLGCECVTCINKISGNKEGVSLDNQDKSVIYFSRSVFKGKLNAVIGLDNFDQMTLLTVQPGSFVVKKKTDTYNDKISILHIDINSNSIAEATSAISHQIEYGGIIQLHGTKSKLNDAKVIVAAGRGIVERENINYIEKFATCLTDAAVAGSRPLIDMGWLPYEQQVGITGAVVSPELYIAIGISGSSQHIAGMKDSRFIVSINKDPNAAIFNYSDICIVEDSITFVKVFIEEISNSRDF